MQLEKIEKIYNQLDDNLKNGLIDKEAYLIDCKELRDATNRIIDALKKNISNSIDMQNYLREEREQELTGDWNSKDHDTFADVIALFTDERRKNNNDILLNVDDLNNIACKHGMTPPTPICEKGREHDFARELAMDYDSWGHAIDLSMDKIAKSGNHREFIVSEHIPFTNDIIKHANEFMKEAKKGVSVRAIGNNYLAGNKTVSVGTGDFIVREGIGGISRDEPREDVIAIVDITRDTDGMLDRIPVPATYFPNLDKYYIDENTYIAKIYPHGRPIARVDAHDERDTSGSKSKFNNKESVLVKYGYYPSDQNLQRKKKIVHDIITQGKEPKTVVIQVLKVHANFAGTTPSYKNVDKKQAKDVLDYANSLYPPTPDRTQNAKDIDVITRKPNSQRNQKGIKHGAGSGPDSR